MGAMRVFNAGVYRRQVPVYRHVRYDRFSVIRRRRGFCPFEQHYGQQY